MPRANTGPRLAMGPSGNWEIRWTDCGRSRRRSTGEFSRRKAEKVLADFLMDSTPRDRTNRMTVGEAMDIYYREHVQVRVVDKERVEITMIPLKRHFGKMPCADVRQPDADNYTAKRIAGKLGRKVKPGTIRRELTTLLAAVNYAAKQKHISRDDVPALIKPDAPPPKETYLTHDQADDLLAAARRPRTKLFILIALATAARKRSIETLTWKQVDLTRGTIDYRDPDATVTKKRRVPVPISDTLLPILKAEWDKAKTPYVLGHTGDTRKSFTTTALRAGLPWVTPHVLRHTWATWAAQSRVPMWEISGMLGDTIETVARVYAHQSPDYLRDAVNAVGRNTGR